MGKLVHCKTKTEMAVVARYINENHYTQSFSNSRSLFDNMSNNEEVWVRLDGDKSCGYTASAIANGNRKVFSFAEFISCPDFVMPTLIVYCANNDEITQIVKYLNDEQPNSIMLAGASKTMVQRDKLWVRIDIAKKAFGWNYEGEDYVGWTPFIGATDFLSLFSSSKTTCTCDLWRGCTCGAIVPYQVKWD